MKVLIAAHYNLNNGDRAVLEATLQAIRNQCPDADIVVSAFDHLQMEVDDRYKCVGWPIKDSTLVSRCYQTMCRVISPILAGRLMAPFINKNYKQALADVDLVLVSGGHHLTDILGSSTYYRLLSNLIYAHIYRKRIVLLPQSIGPTNTDRITEINRKILKQVHFIAYRDKTSKEYLDKNGVATPSSHVPDVVFFLPTKKADCTATHRRLQVGIALYCNYPETKRNLFEHVTKELVESIKYLINEKNADVNFIPMEIQGSKADDRIYASKIIEQLDESEKERTKICKADSARISDTISLFGENDIILAFKTHSVIFSAISSVPVIAIAYHPKSKEFMQEMNLDEYVITDRDMKSNELCSMVTDALHNKDEITRKEETAIQINVKKIQSFMNEILK